MVFVESFIEGDKFYELTLRYNLLIMLLPKDKDNKNYFNVVLHEYPKYGLVTLFFEKTIPRINKEFFSNIVRTVFTIEKIPNESIYHTKEIILEKPYSEKIKGNILIKFENISDILSENGESFEKIPEISLNYVSKDEVNKIPERLTEIQKNLNENSNPKDTSLVYVEDQISDIEYELDLIEKIGEEISNTNDKDNTIN